MMLGLHDRVRRLAERGLELRYGLDTSGFHSLQPYGLDHEQRVWYDPSEWLSLRRTLKRMDITSEDVFCDLGAGKGRAVLVAALEFPFRRVIGVEIADEMTQIARENIERNRRRLRAQEVELVTADALAYELPADLSVLYLFCPFVGDIFAAALARVLEAVDRSGRALRIVYNFPFEHSRLIATGRAHVIDVQSSRWPLRDRSGPEVIVTYVVTPAGRPEAAEPYLRDAARRVKGAEQWLGPYDPGFVVEGHGHRIASPAAR